VVRIRKSILLVLSVLHDTRMVSACDTRALAQKVSEIVRDLRDREDVSETSNCFWKHLEGLCDILQYLQMHTCHASVQSIFDTLDELYGPLASLRDSSVKDMIQINGFGILLTKFRMECLRLYHSLSNNHRLVFDATFTIQAETYFIERTVSLILTPTDCRLLISPMIAC
jgi:hypothetical protein